MDKHTLVSIAHDLVAEGKGILAADESSGTIKRKWRRNTLMP
jgi:fructose-bisphosphate aldolase class 1